MNWYFTVLKNYANFSGRARRKEYWMFVLFNIIFSVLAVVLDNIFGTTMNKVDFDLFGIIFRDTIGVNGGLFLILYAIAVLIPGLAVQIRRLHDVGKSGWYILVALIPIIGAIWLIVLFCTDSVVEQINMEPIQKKVPD